MAKAENHKLIKYINLKFYYKWMVTVLFILIARF